MESSSFFLVALLLQAIISETTVHGVKHLRKHQKGGIL